MNALNADATPTPNEEPAASDVPAVPTNGVVVPTSKAAAPANEVAAPANEAATAAPQGALTFVNVTAYPAEFRMMQGSDQVARVGVAQGGRVQVPVGNSYAVQAMTSMGSFTYTSNRLTFQDSAAVVLAQMQMEAQGLFLFQLVLTEAADANALVFENTWREPVSFNITANGSPSPTVKVVDANNTSQLSTAEQWQVYAIINGITTPSVTTDDPEAVFTAVADADGEGFTLVVT